MSTFLPARSAVEICNGKVDAHICARNIERVIERMHHRVGPEKVTAVEILTGPRCQAFFMPEIVEWEQVR
jgi:hypothetical protein